MIKELEFQKLVDKFEAELTTRYLYFTDFYGALMHSMRTVKISPRLLNNEIIDAFKLALCNKYHGGFDPEFSSEDSFKAWNDFNMDIFQFTTENEIRNFIFETKNPYRYYESPEKSYIPDLYRSPFIDKTIPYPIILDERYIGSSTYKIADFKAWRTQRVASKYGL